MNRFWTIFIIIVTYSFILAQNSKSFSAIHDLEDRVTVIATTVQGMEQEHLNKLKAEVEEQRSLLQRMGLKKP